MASQEEEIAEEIGIVPRMDNKALAQFVMDFLDNKLFSSVHIRDYDLPHMMGSIFMVLLLGGLSNFPQSEMENIGLIYEYYDKRCPLGVNGYPTFASCHIMHKEDWAKALKMIEKEEERRNNALKEFTETLSEEAV